MPHAESHALFNGAPIVVFGSFCRYDWSHLRQRQHNVVEWLARANDVIYVERMGATRMGPARATSAVLKRLNRTSERQTAGVASAGPAVPSSLRFVSAPVIPAHGVALADAANARSILRRVAKELGGRPLSECVAFACYPSPYVTACLEQGGFRFVVYDAAHRYSLVPEVYGRDAQRHDQRIAELVDVCSCDSSALVGDRAQQGIECLQVPQGVAEGFMRLEAPEAAGHPTLAALRRLRSAGRVAGFVGAVSDVVDADLLNAFASEFDGAVVVVGPAHGDPVGHLSERIVHVGAVPGDLVPQVMQLLDVGLIPYVRNTRTDAVLPTKLVEYLASGCVVVSTRLPEVVELAQRFPGAIALSDSAEGWRDSARSRVAMPEGVSEAVRTDFAWERILAAYGDELERRFASAEEALR